MMWKRQFASMALCLLLTGWLHAQWRLFSYDDGQPAYVDPHVDAFVAVRFTSTLPLKLDSIRFMVFNTSNSTDGCHVWIEQTGDGSPTYLGHVPPPLPDKAWVKFNLPSPRQLRAGDFYVILQQPGGPVSGPGWWVALDNGTTTQRTRMCYDGQTWVDYTVADALIRVEGTMDSPAGADFGTAYGSFPSRLAQAGPYHQDVSQEWIGGPSSVTTVEDDALTMDQDDEITWWWNAQNVVWFGTRVSYNPAISDPCDTRYVNVLVDLDGNGQWDGGDEWAVRNCTLSFEAVPQGVNTMYLVQRISDSVNPNQVIGKWARVTLSLREVPDGTGAWGAFDRGETEDFQIQQKPRPQKLIPAPAQVRALRRIVKRRSDRCPHDFDGAIMASRGYDNPCDYWLVIPGNTTSVRLRMFRAHHCNRGCTQLWHARVATPVPLVGPPAPGLPPALPPLPAELWRGQARGLWGPELIGPWGPRGGLVLGRKNVLRGWFDFDLNPDETGHDNPHVEVRLVFDPDNEWICLHDWESLTLHTIGEEYAICVDPPYGATDVSLTPELAWLPGVEAFLHDVYLGTSPEAVAEADVTDTTGVYRGRREATAYVPDAPLEPGVTYYWRIDEVVTQGEPLGVYQGRISMFTTADGSLEPEPSGGLVGHWTFDEGSGSVAYDSSGYRNYGWLTLRTPPDPAWVHVGPVAPDAASYALEFRGNGDVDFRNPGVLDFGTGDWSVSAWIRTTQWGTGDENKGTIFAKGGDWSGGIRYALAVGETDEGAITLTTDDDVTKVPVTGTAVVNDDQWHHVAGIRDGSTLRLYIDGEPDGTADLPAGYDLSGTSQHNACAGAITDHRDGSRGKYFRGLIDEVQIYNRALNHAEVLAQME